MDTTKSLDKYKLIATLLGDIQTSHGCGFNTRSLRLDLKKIQSRLRTEGDGFLTKSLPKLGKALDKALAMCNPLNAAALGFKPQQSSKLPKLFGELFNRVLAPDGTPLSNPCITCIKHIRQITYLFYKYELPYSHEQEQQVVSQFIQTEYDLAELADSYDRPGRTDHADYPVSGRPLTEAFPQTRVTRAAQDLLSRLFASFDPKDIHPQHGPGVVSTKERLESKYEWTNISANITRQYPVDAYFFASFGHVCDHYQSLNRLGSVDHSARVILVPKDSRGPRLISCEPVDYQWVQQGLGRAIVRHVEKHWLTKYNVFFSDQVPNRIGALYGSDTGKYATLDLKEASDRVSLGLVRLLFPTGLLPYLEACRSSSTVLPDGTVLPLYKFAPMGSALCFPVMALTVWALLTAGMPDADARESIHVYGDDVIVPTAQAENAIELLESYGLKINRDKSCIKGHFRESCGMDAYKGVDVTPTKLRSVWSSEPSPDAYDSWMAYARQFFTKRYYGSYWYVAELLHNVYGELPADDMGLFDRSCPSLPFVPDEWRPKKKRVNAAHQRVQYRVTVLKVPSVTRETTGYAKLLRFFSERGKDTIFPQREIVDGVLVTPSPPQTSSQRNPLLWDCASFSVSSYTRRNTSMLVQRWR